MKRMLLAALAAAALTACSDETVSIREAYNAPLQVATFIRTETGAGRGLVMGEAFTQPGHTVSVSLFDATTGGSYEKQLSGYVNVPYVSQEGTAPGKVVWRGADPIYLAPSEGKAIAYYPHSASVTDIHAVPVETDSQTDYMYSSWVAGISSNPGQVQARFTMQHALTGIDVHLTRGDYDKGEGRVTSVSVSSAGFGTAGVLDVDGGALRNVTGHGVPVAIRTDKVIGPQGASNPVLVVPDAAKGVQAVTVKLTIDGRRYSKTFDMAEPFRQGVVYRYRLRLTDSRLDVTSVTVTDWKLVEKQEGGLLPERPDPNMP